VRRPPPAPDVATCRRRSAKLRLSSGLIRLTVLYRWLSTPAPRPRPTDCARTERRRRYGRTRRAGYFPVTRCCRIRRRDATHSGRRNGNVVSLSQQLASDSDRRRASDRPPDDVRCLRRATDVSWLIAFFGKTVDVYTKVFQYSRNFSRREEFAFVYTVYT